MGNRAESQVFADLQEGSNGVVRGTGGNADKQASFSLSSL